MTPTHLIGIYRADGGLSGELRYLAGHYLRGLSCSLCDITHSPFRRKAAWDVEVAKLGIPFDLLHLNELDRDLAAHVGDDAAMVVAPTAQGYVTLLDNTELSAVHGDVATFFTALRARLAAR